MLPWLVGCTALPATHLEACTGGPIGVPYRGVQAFANAPWHGQAKSCGGDDDRSRLLYGYAYQCVELVRRFYATNHGPNRGNKDDSWPRDHAANLWEHAEAMGFKRFINGQTPGERPQPDDLIVFNPSATQRAGHIAIISQVDSASIQVFEQNWSPTAYATLPAQARPDGTFFIADRKPYTVRGWMGQRKGAGERSAGAR